MMTDDWSLQRKLLKLQSSFITVPG